MYTIDTEDSLYQLEKMPWVFTSESPTKTTMVEYVEDIYATMLEYEKQFELF